MKWKWQALVLLTTLIGLLIWGCGQVYSPLTYSAPPAQVLPPTLVADFENRTMTDALLQPITYDWNTSNCSINVDFVPPSPSSTFYWDASPSAGASSSSGGNPAGTPGSAIHISGYMAANVCCNWPYAELNFGINSSGADLYTLAPNHQLSFAYKAGPASKNLRHRLNFMDKTITDYAWYTYYFTPPDTNWHTLTINFPGDNCSSSCAGCSPATCFLQESWGAPHKWGTVRTNITNIVFAPFTASTGSNFDIVFDDIWFK